MLQKVFTCYSINNIFFWMFFYYTSKLNESRRNAKKNITNSWLSSKSKQMHIRLCKNSCITSPKNLKISDKFFHNNKKKQFLFKLNVMLSRKILFYFKLNNMKLFSFAWLILIIPVPHVLSSLQIVKARSEKPCIIFK